MERAKGNMEILSLTNVSKAYNDSTKALIDISLSVKRGEIVGVIGRNGAGKSTMFKILCGLIEDYEGKSLIFGEKSSIKLSERISYLPEVRGLDSRRFVLEHLVELVMYKGISKKCATVEVEKWLKEFSLYDRRYSKISALSKGNQQRVQLIVAIASKPEVLILDEPFSGLDLITIDYFWKILLKLREEGCTIIFSTHDLNDNMLLCDKFVFLDKGKLEKRGSLEEIQNSFPVVLELKNISVKKEDIVTVAGEENVQRKNDEYYIRLNDESDARTIFDGLSEKYSEKFYVRKMNISEIFREISG